MSDKMPPIKTPTAKFTVTKIALKTLPKSTANAIRINIRLCESGCASCPSIAGSVFPLMAKQ
jgi:hypothetical protein